MCSDIYELPRHLNEQFDIVFTSYGVLSWLADLAGWAKLVESYIKPGGIFYIAELHPFAMMFDENSQSPTLHYPYFDEQMLECEVQGSYAEPLAQVETKISYEWPYTIGGVVTALSQAGLSIEFLHEFPFTVFPQLAYLKQFDERTWRQPQGYPEIPMLFSIKATKNH